MTLARRQFLKGLGIGALGVVLSSCYGRLEQIVLPDSNQNHYRMAFVTLGRESSDFTFSKYDIIENVKSQFPESFNEATEGLASIDTSYDIVDMIDDGTMIGSQGVVPGSQDAVNTTKVAQKFYEEHSDEFDFISIYPIFTPDFDNPAYHVNAQNKIEGIGNKVFDSVSLFGSNGRLLGVNCLHNHSIQNNIPIGDTSLQNALLHETGHQWGVHVGDDFSADPNTQLEIKQQGMHFYRGLESPFVTGTAIYSDHWVPNGDGTFRRENESGIKRYHPFQLYFMGLLNEDNYDFTRKFKILNAGIVGKDFNPDKALPYKEVSIQDIIQVEGPRREII
jgi:hypothetical protein